jgi:hypothetical protein
LPNFQQFEAESFDLRENAEQCRSVFNPTGEHGLGADQLMRHRRKSRQGGGPELTFDSDCVQDSPCGRAVILPPDRVSPPTPKSGDFGRRRTAVTG